MVVKSKKSNKNKAVASSKSAKTTDKAKANPIAGALNAKGDMGKVMQQAIIKELLKKHGSATDNIKNSWDYKQPVRCCCCFPIRCGLILIIMVLFLEIFNLGLYSVSVLPLASRKT